MKRVVIVDTNVPITANGHATHVSPACQLACISALRLMQAERRISLDQTGLMLQEYRKHLAPSGQPGLGDAFFKWLWYNQANPQVCILVAITPTTDGRDFAEFPDDPALEQFDRADRKFVAVARAQHSSPPIINAVDTDWLEYQEVLAAHGVTVEHVCLDDLHRLLKAHR
ncbi:hypothetical protein [Candidatus Viridilinea mediisalina]|uniref:PIN domain-containing protein n=1 Tax=Candidatus Viridilinea mediisalina TaxID=2024553 RepID=A0A2A6RKM5_9CHLR|nr:hypothetical protein [Candidatus Viridilinea mediisalina]PDW03439.1 hypothetical protein CJ255_08910 [Candidatus Viridilinea mediisalina]